MHVGHILAMQMQSAAMPLAVANMLSKGAELDLFNQYT